MLTRTDCAVIHGTGEETMTENGFPVRLNFTFIRRSDWRNYEDSETYDFKGNSMTGVTYNEESHNCGPENFV